jgi:hypothetical protein
VNTQRSVNVYRHLLVLYPKSFRSEYGDDLIAALVLAVVAGTGPVVGVFLCLSIVCLVIATLSLVIATLSWNTARPFA